MSWLREITPAQWRALLAAKLGWVLDAADVMLYAFALTEIQREFGLSGSGAGLLATVTLAASAVGGVLFGVIADRVGRVRALAYAILTYSVFTALIATATSVPELILWRALVGIGLGGEWTAGSVLVAETWPAEHRGKAIGLMQSGWALGYILAAALAGLILPRWGWRVLFVCGIAPALFTLWFRRHVPEPPIWRDTAQTVPPLAERARTMFRPPLRRLTLISMALTSSVMFAYWGLFTWVPAFLASPVERGGAGLGLVRSTLFVIPMQIGAYFGYTLFGLFADRVGRRPAFVAFVAGAALLVPVYGLFGRSEAVLMLLGPPLGFLGHGYFSVFGATFAEIFPSRVRATAQGFCYSFGRGVSALAPFTIGWLADSYGIGPALAVTAAFFLAGAGFMMLLPETRGAELG